MDTLGRSWRLTIYGALYGLVVAAIGISVSGGGHFNLVSIPVIWPHGFGVFLWPLLGYLSANLKSNTNRIIFVILLIGQYIGSGWSEYKEFSFDFANFAFPALPSHFVVVAMLGTLIFIVGQFLLWREFFRSFRDC